MSFPLLKAFNLSSLASSSLWFSQYLIYHSQTWTIFKTSGFCQKVFLTSSSLCFRRNARLPLRLRENKKDSNLKFCSICEQNLTSISCLHFPEEYSQWGWLCLWETLSCERNMKRGFFAFIKHEISEIKNMRDSLYQICRCYYYDIYHHHHHQTCWWNCPLQAA